MVVSFSMFPLDKGARVGKYVARVIDIVDKSGLPYQAGSMSTTLEGDWDKIFTLIKRCNNALRKDCRRIYTVITIDDRKGARGRIKGKVEDVEKILKRKIKR
jgi:uncharacterized protein (TIGR00106 family)